MVDEEYTETIHLGSLWEASFTQKRLSKKDIQLLDWKN